MIICLVVMNIIETFEEALHTQLPESGFCGVDFFYFFAIKFQDFALIVLNSLNISRKFRG